MWIWINKNKKHLLELDKKSLDEIDKYVRAFTKNMIELRLENKYSQQEVADAIGVSRITYLNMERGNSLNFDRCVLISRLYGKTFCEFLNCNQS